jgi:cytochrome P450
MAAATVLPVFDPSRPLKISSREWANHQFEAYPWLLEEAPVTTSRIAGLKISLVSRYDDCRMVLTDPRFIRNRAKARGKPGSNPSPLPIPLPKSVSAMAISMIVQDDPNHRRLRNLVNKAFTAHAVAKLGDRVETLSHQLLDRLQKEARFDLLEDYARPIPTVVIAEMMGVESEDAARFDAVMKALESGLSVPAMLRALVWDLPRSARFVRELIERKRHAPGEDILSRLIHVEEEGDLLEHPDQLERLRAEPALWESGVEEMIRHRGPVQGTKPMWATEDVTLHGVTIPKGSPVIPLLGAANHDPRVFDDPERFDVGRTPNRHLGFGFGMHFCLGAQLARMETRIALVNLFERLPDLRLAVPPETLERVPLPAWNRHVALPVKTGA